MKYFEMHDEVYEKLAKDGKVSWNGAESPEELFNHEINIALSERIDHYFPNKTGLKVIDFGCGSGTASLYLAKLGFDVTGYDVSANAINMANKNKEALGLRADFYNYDLTILKKEKADFTVDSNLLHCLVDFDDRCRFFQLCADITFIHTMVEANDMSDLTDRDYLTLKDEVLWSTGPERWGMDWQNIDGRKMFKHRRIRTEKDLLTEIAENGFHVLEYKIVPVDKCSSTFVGWIERDK